MAVRRNVTTVRRNVTGTPTGRPLLFVLRALGLGDFLVGVPAYRALRRAFPDHELRLATTAGVAPLADFVGGIDAVAPARGPDAFATPERAVDIAINLHGKGPQSTAALGALHPRRFIGFGSGGSGDSCVSGDSGDSSDSSDSGDSSDSSDSAPSWDDGWTASERERWTYLLAAFGIAADPLDLALNRPDVASPAPHAVVVHPGAAYESRRWPAGRFAEVARALRAAGHRVVITGVATEVELAHGVVERAALPARSLLAGRTDVVELAALVADARLVVCGDTGPAHLASAFGTPSVVLFGPTPPTRWGPPASPRHLVLWPSLPRRTPPDPWGNAIDPALAAIGVDDVTAAAFRLLADEPLARAG